MRDDPMTTEAHAAPTLATRWGLAAGCLSLPGHFGRVSLLFSPGPLWSTPHKLICPMSSCAPGRDNLIAVY